MQIPPKTWVSDTARHSFHWSPLLGVSFITILMSNLCTTLTTQNTTKKIWIISHTQNTTKFQPILFLIGIPHFLVTKKRRSALSSTNYQGQLQIPQSLSVVATQSIWETLGPKYMFICGKYRLDRE